MKNIWSPAPIPPGNPLTPGVVDLWCFYYAHYAEPSLLAAYAALLTPDEHARHDRFRFEPDKRMFLATRALVRTVLSQYVDVAPTDWRFSEGESGKPYVSGPPGVPRIEFNLSNTHGLIACVVSLFSQIGVDAEWLGRPGETVSIADQYFSPTEVRELRAQHPEVQGHHFFRYWTLKESYIKARGLGLALPLDQFSFHWSNNDHIRITFNSQVADDPRNWRFALLDGPSHMVAVSAQTGGLPLLLRVCSYVPLRGVVTSEAEP